MKKKIICLLLIFAMIFSTLSPLAENWGFIKEAWAEETAEETAAETTPAQETTAAEETSPEESTPAEETTVAEETTASEETSPEETTAAEENSPEESTAAEETTEAEETTAEETTLAESEPLETQPAEETDPAEDPTNPVETLPIEESDPAEAPILSQEAQTWSAALEEGTITVWAQAGAFPENAALSVTTVPLAEQYKVETAVGEVREEGRNVALSFTFDIKILDAEGNELQPAEGKLVKVSFELAPVASANLTPQVYHTDDEYNTTELPVETQEETATVETGGFSFFTVEFTYGEKEYVLDGFAEVLLSDILELLELSGEVESWEVSNAELFDIFLGNETGIIYGFEPIDEDESLVVPTNDGDIPWMLSLQPFRTEEWLKVVIEGIEYKIVVTDDDLTNTVPIGYQGSISTRLESTVAIDNDKYYKDAMNAITDENPMIVKQSTSTTSLYDFAAGLPLSNIYIDEKKFGPSKGIYQLENQSLEGVIIHDDNDNVVKWVPSGGFVNGQANKLDGDLFSFLFEDAAILPDGSRANIKITYSNAAVYTDERLYAMENVPNATDEEKAAAKYVGGVYIAQGSVFRREGTDSRQIKEGSVFTERQIHAAIAINTARVNQYKGLSGMGGMNTGFNNNISMGIKLDATYEILDKNNNPINGTFIFTMAGVNLDRDPFVLNNANAGKGLYWVNGNDGLPDPVGGNSPFTAATGAHPYPSGNLQGDPNMHFFSEQIAVANNSIASEYIYVRPNNDEIEIRYKEDGTTIDATLSGYYPQVVQVEEDGVTKTKFIGNAIQTTSSSNSKIGGGDNFYASGFVTLATTGFTITGYGHCYGANGGAMNTQAYGAKKIWYRYTSGSGPNGNIQTTSEGNHNGTLDDKNTKGEASKILDPSTYVVAEGKTVTYTLTPNNGFQIAELKYRNASGNLLEVKYNGKPLSTMKDGQTLTFNDAAGRTCTLTAVEETDVSTGETKIKFILEVPYAQHDEEFQVKWERTAAKLTVKKETFFDEPGDFTFWIRAHRDFVKTTYTPVQLGSVFKQDGVYKTELGGGAGIAGPEADAMAAKVSGIALLERVEVSGGSYLWKTDKKLSFLGLAAAGSPDDDDLFIHFESAPSAAIGDTLATALDVGLGASGPERIYFYDPKTTKTDMKEVWNFSTNKAVEVPLNTEATWYDFELANQGKKEFTLQRDFIYEVYEEAKDGWELVSVDGAVGVNRIRELLSVDTDKAPEHVYRNRKLPDLTVKKETEQNAPGSFYFTLKLTAPAVPEQTYTVTGTATVTKVPETDAEGNVIGYRYPITYSFKNNGVAFGVNKTIIPSGIFSDDGPNTDRNKICEKLLDLTASTDDNDRKIMLGTEQGEMRTTEPKSLKDWALEQSALEAGTEDGLTKTVTFTFSAPERAAGPCVLDPLPSGVTPVDEHDSSQGYKVTASNDAPFTLTDLPYGVSYEIVEIVPVGWEQLNKLKDNGDLTDDTTAIFTNRKLVDLTVSKTVTGNQGSRDKYFKFTITLKGCVEDSKLILDMSNAHKAPTANAATGATAAKMAEANSKDDDNNPDNGQQIAVDGDGKVTEFYIYLQHGQSFTIKGIPYGASYTVTEDPDGYKSNLKITGDGLTGDKTSTGTPIGIGDGVYTSTDSWLTETTTLAFTNTRDGMIPTEIRTRPLIAGIILLAIALPVLFGAGLPRGRVALEKVPVEAHRGRSRKRQSRR